MGNHKNGTMPRNSTHEAGVPGVFDMRPIEAELKRSLPEEPELVWDGVLDAVSSPKDESESLAMLHSRRYDSLSGPGANTPLFVKLRGLCKGRISEIQTYLVSLKELAAATDQFIDEPGDGTSWTVFDLVKVVVLSLVSLGLLGIGVFTVSQILQASGLPGFESPVRRYLFSGVPVAAAFALKCIGNLLVTDRSQRRFIGFTLITGIVLAFAWSWLFVWSFDSGPLASPGEVLAELMADSDESSDSGDNGSALLFVGLLAEMFLAAGCWLEIERIVIGHRRARRTPNPFHEAIENKINYWSDEFFTVSTFEGRLEARLAAIENGRKTYVSQALNHYHLRRRGLAVDMPTASPPGADYSDGQRVAQILNDNPSRLNGDRR